LSRPGVVISSSLIRTLYIPQTHSIARSFLWAGAIGQREKTETADGRRNRNKFEPTKTHFASPVRLDTYKIHSHTAEDGPCLCPTYLIGKPRQHERTNERTDGRGEKPYCIRCVDSRDSIWAMNLISELRAKGTTAK
jgi:hypothetical protein